MAYLSVLLAHPWGHLVYVTVALSSQHAKMDRRSQTVLYILYSISYISEYILRIILNEKSASLVAGDLGQ